MILQIDHLEKRGLFTYLNPDLPRSDDNRIPLLVHIQPGNRLPGIVRQNAGFRFRLGVADNTAFVISENTENVIPVKSSVIRRLLSSSTSTAAGLIFLAPSTAWTCCPGTGFSNAASAKPEKEMDNPKASRTEFRNMPWSIEFPIIVVFYIIQRSGIAERMQTVVSRRAADRFHSLCRLMAQVILPHHTLCP